MRALLSVPSPLIFVVVVAASLRTLRSKDRTVRDTNSVIVMMITVTVNRLGATRENERYFSVTLERKQGIRCHEWYKSDGRGSGSTTKNDALA